MTASVLHVVQHLRPGGLETLVLEMQARDPNCHVVSLEGDAVSAYEHWPRLKTHGDRIHYLGKRPGLQSSLIWALRGLMRDLRPVAVHTHHVGPMIYGGMAARLAGVPCWVHTEHDAWHLDDPKRAALVRSVAMLLRPVLVADADAVADRVRARCGLKAQTIRNGIDVKRFKASDRGAARATFGLPANARIIGTAGRQEPEKNQALLLRAFALGRGPWGDHLVLAGDGSQGPVLRSMAQRLGLQDNVHFLGRVDRMPELLSALDLFVLPSDKEGYPLSLLEAQACDVPVIATRVGGTADAVCPRTGTLIEAGDAEGLARALGTRSRPSPRRFVLEVGSIEAMMAQYEALYGIRT